MKKILVLTMFSMTLLTACVRVPTLAPYKMEIQQGNYVTQDMIAKLKPGMSRSQVRFALGTPLLVDPFRTDRWDYVYRLYKQGNLVEERGVTVLFNGDVLARIEGDVVVGGGAAQVPGSDKPAAPATPEKK